MLVLFKRVEDTFEGEAGTAGFTTEEEMQDYMKKICKEVKVY